jgi:hypothetical protein
VDVADRVKGWCPVHDRVYEAADGACPECGTTLVSLAEKKKRGGSLLVIQEQAEDAEVQPVQVEPDAPRSNAATAEAPVQIGVAAIAAAAAVIVAGAFFLGVAITRGKGTGTAPVGVPKARADYNAEAVRNGAGIALRLESFAQRGRDIVIRVTVPPEQGIELGRISSVLVTPFTAGSQGLERVRLEVRVTTSGFVATGRAVPDARIPVTGLEITSLTQNLSGTGELLRVDLSRVWPVAGGGAPRSAAASGTARYSDGHTYRLTGLVGWPDRVEAGFVVGGDRKGWSYDEAFSLAFDRSGEAAGALVDVPPVAGARQVVFKGIPASVTSGAIKVVVKRFTVGGRWRWMFT